MQVLNPVSAKINVQKSLSIYKPDFLRFSIYGTLQTCPIHAIFRKYNADTIVHMKTKNGPVIRCLTRDMTETAKDLWTAKDPWNTVTAKRHAEAILRSRFQY